MYVLLVSASSGIQERSPSASVGLAAGTGETVSSVTATASPLSRSAETAAVFTSPP